MDGSREAEYEERLRRPFRDPNPPPWWCFWQRRTYWIDDSPLGDDGFILRLRRNGYWVGEAILSFTTESDFHIDGFCIEKPYRRRGLGRALLKAVLDFIRERDGRVVRGEIVRRDLDEFTRLREWYRESGFTVGLPHPDDRKRGEGSERVASLELWLKRLEASAGMKTADTLIPQLLFEFRTFSYVTFSTITTVGWHLEVRRNHLLPAWESPL